MLERDDTAREKVFKALRKECEELEWAEAETLRRVVVFLKDRAKQLHDMGGVHIRESVSLFEAAIMIENGMLIHR
jgi:hypothetical protein